MKVFASLLLIIGLVVGTAFAEIIRFDKTEIGQLPDGWRVGVTGAGLCTWSIVNDETKKVLKQSSELLEHSYPWCIRKDASVTNGYVQVKLKAISGFQDQGGGIIWRYKDGDNYYVARANALEDNVTVYYTLNGQRRECGRAAVKVSSGQWHTLRIDFQGTHFFLTFDGERALEWEDNTFKDGGAVGLWTKADSVIEFDDFEFAAK